MNKPIDTPPVDTPPVDPTPPAEPPTDTPSATSDTNPTPPAEPTPAPEPATTPEPVTPPAEPDAAPPTDDTPPLDEPPVDRVVPAAAEYTRPEGVPIEMAQFAHDNDLTQAQFDATLTQFGQILQGTEQHKLQTMRAEGEKLVESWGNQKQYNMSVAQRALQQNDPDGALKEVLDISGFGNHPAVLSFFLRVGNSMKEGGFLKGANNTPGNKGVSAADAMFGKNHPSSN